MEINFNVNIGFVQVKSDGRGQDVITLDIDNESSPINDPITIEIKTPKGRGTWYCEHVLKIKPNAVINL